MEAPLQAKPPGLPAPRRVTLTKLQMAINLPLVGSACTVAQWTVHWTQTAMVRQQLAAMAGDPQPFVGMVRAIHGAEGVRGLYRGFSAAALREMSYSTLRFGLYEPIKIVMGAGVQNSPFWINVLAGITSGTFAAAVASPTDLITIRMMKHDGVPLRFRETVRGIVSEGSSPPSTPIVTLPIRMPISQKV